MKSITSSGRESLAMIIEDPIPPEDGKGACPCFEAGCAFIPSLRRLGARSVYIQSTVFDRALQSPLKRMFQQRSELSYDNLAQGDVPQESNLDCLLEWFDSIGCVHDTEVPEIGIVRVDIDLGPH